VPVCLSLIKKLAGRAASWEISKKKKKKEARMERKLRTDDGIIHRTHTHTPIDIFGSMSKK
jgi:hypothetical protein